MTCPHCQTWILDDEHRCQRCGRRVRGIPSRISPERFPIAAAATASAYRLDQEVDRDIDRDAPASRRPEPREAGQQRLFANYYPDPRLIPFDALTSPVERESIRARAANLARPTPLKTGRVEVRHARPKKPKSQDQRTLDFQGQESLLTQPRSDIICDAPVAPARVRIEAAAIDGLVILFGYMAAALLFIYSHEWVWPDKHELPFFAMALVTIPLVYKLIWTAAGRDSFGMQCAGIRTVDFDGNPPSQERRYQRLFGSILSFLAAGVGLIWVFVDQDRLTWHDHISGTFPTIDTDH